MSKIIAIEGIDGAGKATQAERLASAINATLFSFPNYETATGKLLKAHLTSGWTCATYSKYLRSMRTDKKANMIVRQSLMTINRCEATSKINRSIKDGKNIVFDRWWLSSLAYGVTEGVDRDWIVQISSSLIQPDLWIYLDVPGVVGGNRRKARDDNERDIPKLERVRQNYLNEIANMRDLAVVIDGTASIDQVTHSINEAITRVLR